MGNKPEEILPSGIRIVKANEIYFLPTEADFRREVLECRQPVLVEFSADWCGLGHMMAPVIEEMAARFRNRIKFCRMDVDRERDVGARYGIQKFPAILFFKGGEAVDCITGAAPRRMIEQKIHALLDNEGEA